MNYTYRLIERMAFPVDVTEQLEQKDADRMTERGSQRELIARLKLIKRIKKGKKEIYNGMLVEVEQHDVQIASEKTVELK